MYSYQNQGISNYRGIWQNEVGFAIWALYQEKILTNTNKTGLEAPKKAILSKLCVHICQQLQQNEI